ncbi:MAG: class I SAM-dependent methyltransferase [Sphingobacteriales bacterium]|nr:MAG: class I SAM-dependent methyltransferase [Sphingobacteriales bacterium]
MSLKGTLKLLLPDFIKSEIKAIGKTRELKKFTSQRKLHCVTENLLSEKGISLPDIFNSDEIEGLWKKSQKELDVLNIPDDTDGGVNAGDRRALYYLISKFKPGSVLEIGTHIGASTIHIAAALKANNIKASFTTLDIRDVNSTSLKPWTKYGTKYSPAQMIEELKYETFVDFVTDASINYFENCQTRFDFIFLDGDHSALAVYQEIPLALRLLNTNGVILLHDYFPGGKPLWSNNSVISGPYLATERLIQECGDLTVLPLGALPWTTKLNSNKTSLALLMKKN